MHEWLAQNWHFQLPWLAYVGYAWTVLAAWVWLYSAGAKQVFMSRFPHEDGTSAILWCAWQELLWSLPGGEQRKAEHIRQVVSPPIHGETCGGPLIQVNGVIFGRTRSWAYHEVRRDESFLECAIDSLPGPWSLPLYAAASILWPLTLIWLIALLFIPLSRAE